jgi:amino acid adenylation domain-containing protein
VTPDAPPDALNSQLLGDNGPMSNLSQTEISVLETRGSTWAAPQGATITKRPGNCPIPLSFGQERIWFQTQLAPESALFNESITIHKHGPLDVAALHRSLNEIIRRHQIWRTNFRQSDGQPVQVVQAPFEIDLPFVDLRPLPPEQREAKAVHLATGDATRPFDLANGRLIRARLAQWSEEEHRLFITLHHIIFDGVSIYRVFLPELICLYRAFSTASPVPLREPEIQYADYAYWQRHTVQNRAVQQQVDYWRNRLSGELPVLRLPTDRPRPRVQSFRGAMHTLALSASLTADLRKLSNREGVTLYVTLFAAFATLLYRYTGQRDLPIGSVTAGRTHTEIEGLIGFFLNTVVLRADLSENPTFCELLKRVREVALEALCNDRVPFEYLVKELHPKRDLSVNPLFQTLVSLEPPLAPIDCDWELTQMDVETGASKFDLYLELDERPAGIIGRFIYSTDLFDESTVQRMAGHWEVLLRSIVEHPERRLSEFSLLPETEVRQLLVEFNDTRKGYPQQCIHQIFESRVEQAPDATAIVFEKQEVTYRGLNERANQVARRLRKLGVKPGVAVGIFLERSVEMIVGLLGILKAGGAYVPLGAESPELRLDFVLREAGISVLLSQQSRMGLVRTDGLQVICLDTDWKTISMESRENLNDSYSCDELAYITYTSGTSGVPKGIEIRHRSVVRLLFGVDYVELGPAQTFLQLAPLSFDASTFEIWGALLHGAKCVVFSPKIPVPQELRDIIRNHRVTILWLTSSFFNMLIDEAPDTLLGVRQLLTGGEAVSPAHVSLAYQRLPEVQIINGYGPTESTTFACCYRIPRELTGSMVSTPIGRPIGNTQVYILDGKRNPVPIGVEGEIYIGGDGLARGYLNRPELTAERFVANPFEVGKRMYRTGDVGRYLASGDIEFLGRMDHQVKIRGFRIELGEIEAVLEEQAGVRQAVVEARGEGSGEKRLVAYVVAAKGKKPTAVELRKYVGEKLPEYMVPWGYVFLESLPLTANGKVDRRRLADAMGELGARSGSGGAEAKGASNEVEEELVKIWEGVLGKKGIGVEENFFELGGHSLLAVRLMHRIEREMGKKLAITALLEAPTVAGLAEVMGRGAERSEEWSSLVAIQPEGWRPPFFCVHGIGGTVLRFYDLARHLGPDQPVYGLQAQGMSGKHPCHSRVEDMAAHYLTEIRRLQPHGPYYMGGYSLGGSVALEMARQLRAEGEEIGIVALLDTFASRYQSKGQLLVKFLALAPREKLYHVRRKGRLLGKSLRKTVEMARLPRVLKEVRQACSQAARQYVAQPYLGQLTLFHAEERSLSSENPYETWKTLALGGLEVHEVPGGHGSIIDEPAVRSVAKKLKACLERTQAEYLRVLSHPIADCESASNVL